MPVEQSIEQYYESLFSAEVEAETGQEPAGPLDRDSFMETLAKGTMAHAMRSTASSHSVRPTGGWSECLWWTAIYYEWLSMR